MIVSNWCCLVPFRLNMEALLCTDALQLDYLLENREMLGLMDPDETANVLRSLQDVTDKDIDIGPDDVNNNSIQINDVNRICTIDDVKNSLIQSDDVHKIIIRSDDVDENVIWINPSFLGTYNMLDSSCMRIGVAHLSKPSDSFSGLHDSTIECNNLLDYKYSTSLSGIGAYSTDQYLAREPPEYNDVCSPGSCSASNSVFSPGSSSASNSVFSPESGSVSSSASNSVSSPISGSVSSPGSGSSSVYNSGSKCSSEICYSEFSIDDKSYEHISESTNDISCSVNESLDRCAADISNPTTEPGDQSCLPDIISSTNEASVRSGLRRSARNKEYNLRTSSIINRVETEQRRNTPKKRKPKNKPAPLSKYRRKTANTRERSRMQEVNDAFEELRKVVPGLPSDKGNITKIIILQLAMNYISALREMLGHEDPMDINSCRPTQQDMDCTGPVELNMDDTSEAGQSMDCSGPGSCSNSSSSVIKSYTISTDPEMTSVSICSPRQRISLDTEGEFFYSS